MAAAVMTAKSGNVLLFSVAGSRAYDETGRGFTAGETDSIAGASTGGTVDVGATLVAEGAGRAATPFLGWVISISLAMLYPNAAGLDTIVA